MSDKKMYFYIMLSIVCGIFLFFYDRSSFFDYTKIMGTALIVCGFFILKDEFKKRKK